MPSYKTDFPKIAIIGRPNVGKSTLFNKIVQKRKAVIEKGSSTTRDRLSSIVLFNNTAFELIDTGGMDFDKQSVLAKLTEKQILFAVIEAEIILLVCDVKDGLIPLDEKICEALRKYNKKIILVINKADNNILSQQTSEFYKLGLGEPIPVSGMHGTGVFELLDKIISLLPGKYSCRQEKIHNQLSKTTNIAVVGRPNAGKSSFINALLGEERVIVSHEPGTTRDAIDTYFEKDGLMFTIIDTAGIRSRNKIKDPSVYFSILRTEESIRRSDIVILIIDGSVGITKEDFKIIDSIQRKSRPFIIAVNKWDICIKHGLDKREYEKTVRHSLRFIYNTAIIFISSVTGYNILKVIGTAYNIAEKSKKNFSTQLLHDILKNISVNTTKLYSIRQIKSSRPEFELIAKKPGTLNQSHKNHIINRLREELGLEGVPIKLVFRKKEFRKKFPSPCGSG